LVARRGPAVLCKNICRTTTARTTDSITKVKASKRHRLSRASDLIEIEDTVEIVEGVLVKLTGAHSGDIRVSLPSWKTKLVMKEGKPWEEEGR
jgi:hypothetical protein